MQAVSCQNVETKLSKMENPFVVAYGMAWLQNPQVGLDAI